MTIAWGNAYAGVKKKKKKHPQDVSSILIVQEKMAARKTKSGRKYSTKFTVVIPGRVITGIILKLPRIFYNILAISFIICEGGWSTDLKLCLWAVYMHICMYNISFWKPGLYLLVRKSYLSISSPLCRFCPFSFSFHLHWTQDSVISSPFTGENTCFMLFGHR